MDIPETPEEAIATVVGSLREVHLVDNDDGTITMTFVIGKENPKEFSAVFEATLSNWMGEVMGNMPVSNEVIEEYLGTVTVIPNSPEEE